MDLSRVFIDTVACGMELASIYYFFQCFIGKSPIDKKQLSFFYLAFYCMSMLVALLSSNFETTAISQIVMLVALSRLYTQLIWKRVGYSLLIYIFSLLAEGIGMALAMSLFDITTAQIEASDSYYGFVAITAKLILLTTVICIQLFFKKMKSPGGGTIYIGLLLTPVASLLAIYQIVENTQTQHLKMAIVIAVLLVLANLLVFYIFENQSRIERNQMRLEFVEQQYEEQIIHYNELYAARTDTHKMWHDMSNSLLTMAAYAEVGDIEGIKKYLSEQNQEMYKIRKIIDTNNPKIDAVISVKQRRIEDCIISCTIPDLSQINIESMDIAMLLASALDNAIEACAKLPKQQNKHIKVRMSIQGLYLSVSIENTAIDDLKIEDKCLKTTKPDVLKHGFGMETIKRIAAKYHGDVSFQYVNGEFVLTVLLKSM